MSLNYSISTRHETADTIPNIDNYRGKTGWVTQLQNEYGSKFSDEATIDSHLTGVEKYAYEHDVAGYTWKTDSSGKKVYTPTGVQNPVKGNYGE